MQENAKKHKKDGIILDAVECLIIRGTNILVNRV